MKNKIELVTCYACQSIGEFNSVYWVNYFDKSRPVTGIFHLNEAQKNIFCNIVTACADCHKKTMKGIK